MPKGPKRQWKQDKQEMRLQPANHPASVHKSVYENLSSSLFKFYNMFGDISMKQELGQEIKIRNPTDLYKVSQSMSALAKAGVELERWEFEKQRRIEDVADILMDNMRILLSDRPELYAELLPLMGRSVELFRDVYCSKVDGQQEGQPMPLLLEGAE